MEATRDSRQVCTFCGSPLDHVQKLFQGPDVSICDLCVEKFGSYLFVSKDIKSTDPTLDNNPDSSCCFCGKRSSDVPQLFSSDNAKICTECVVLCLEINAESLGRSIDPDILIRVAAEKLRFSPAHRTYARLSISASHEQEFVDRWQKEFAAALTLDGLVRITFVPGVTLGGRTGWHVVGEWLEPPSKLGDAIKLVTDRMQEAGVLLRGPNWHLAEGITYLSPDRLFLE